MSGSENPNSFFVSYVNKEKVWFLIRSVGNQTDVRNKPEKGLSLDAVSLKSLTLRSTVFRDSSSPPVEITRLHKSILR